MSRFRFGNTVCLLLTFGVAMNSLSNAQVQRTNSQRLLEAAMSTHSDISGLELSATPPGKHACVTIAATEAKDAGERCDEDEFTALNTRRPFVEQEQDGFDVTAPLHDAKGKLVGTLGIDFKPQPGQTKTAILKRTAQIVRDLEQQIPSQAFLFQPAP